MDSQRDGAPPVLSQSICGRAEGHGFIAVFHVYLPGSLGRHKTAPPFFSIGHFKGERAVAVGHFHDFTHHLSRLQCPLGKFPVGDLVENFRATPGDELLE